jgi:hypothetical protein
MPASAYNRTSLVIEAQCLPQRCRQLLLALARRRLLSTGQVKELFYGDLGPASAKSKLAVELSRLSHRHFVYRYLPANSREAVWLLGRAAVPFVELSTGARFNVGEHFIDASEQVAETLLRHDLGSNDVLVSAVRSLRRRDNLVKLAGRDSVASVSSDADGGYAANWHGPRRLALGFYDRTSLRDGELRPDGFMVLDYHRSSWLQSDALPSGQLPFFYEFDRDTRPMRHVADQLLAYHRLALTSAARRRFPDLNVQGYHVPVVMVFSNPRRVAAAQRAVRERATEARLVAPGRSGSPILLVAEADWKADPFAPGIITSAWADRVGGLDLLESLARVSMPLFERLQLYPGRALRLDAEAARPRPASVHRATSATL